MQAHEALIRYFLTGTAEEDRPFLERAFITHDQMANIISVDPGTMRILAGSKGIGKTALFEWLVKIAQRRKLPVILLRPDDLDTKNIGTNADIGTLKRGFYDALVSAIATALGRQLRGLLTGDAAKLYNTAMQNGARDPDFVGKILQLLTAVSVPVAKVNGVQLAKDLAGTANPSNIMRSVTQHLLATGSVLLLLFDDTDQVAPPSDASQLNRIWALLLAVRRLSGECLPLRSIVSLRTEVWARLESESKGQRDQTDHLRGLVTSLRASDDLMQKILLRRLTLAAEEAGVRNVDPYTVFFENPKVRLPTSEELRPWDTFIIKSARERPRDAIQLVKILAERAKANGHQKIADIEANDGMKQYSRERVRDAADEFAHDCGTLAKVIETFSRGEFELPFEKLRTHLKTVGSGFSLVVRGEIIKTDDDESALTLLRFLHETGFINPRVSDSRQPRGFRHINFQDDPYFVSAANWNNLQAATWEIHPAFRSYLLTAKADAQARK